ncbi:hypothetical protein ACFU99_35985 [Streptomyces sp. NPDC057654]|uniref:hypothetical protein n=1 Tax=Streptomyces sp. NPDC057654 TaxID=3346196 RepID=UPI0036CB8FE2
MSVQAERPTIITVAHHWIMTVQTHDGRQATYDGGLDLLPGRATRRDAYAAVRSMVAASLGTGHFVVLFFDLHPELI